MAQLSLTVLRCPDYGLAEQRQVRGVELTIGRGTECDWALSDPLRSLSRKHCRLERVGSAWQVVDLSANGTFINFASDPIGREQAQPLRDGDHLRLGDYELEVRLSEPTAAGLGSPFDAAAPADLAGMAGAAGVCGFGDSVDAGLFGAVPNSAGRSAAPVSGGFGSVRLPGLDEPVEPVDVAGSLDLDISGELGSFAPDAGPVPLFGAQEDHAPSTGDAYRPPAVMPTPASGPAPGAGAASLVPDDWLQSIALGQPVPAAAAASFDLSPPAPADPLPAAAGAPAQPAPFNEAPAASPFDEAPAASGQADDAGPGFADSTAPGAYASVWPDAVDLPLSEAEPAPLLASLPEPFSEPFLAPAALSAAVPPRPAVVAPASPPAQPPVVARSPVAPVSPTRVAPVAPAVTAPPAVAEPDSLLTALAVLMAGGGLPAEVAQRSATDPDAALRHAGALLQVTVAGLRALLVARGLVKREFRIEQTMLRPKENNPLKFAASDEHALASLLDPRMSGLKAVQDAVDDLSSHEVAVLAATQAAAHALLDKLSPAALEADDPGGSGLFGASPEKRLWLAYKRRHATLTAQLEDDFDSAFGIAFARAYEQAVGKRRG